ncbi:cilia- and flagella-associated protein 65 [Ceratina calcarata]|uniref:Cilia- and flagella-associated protein 65 n=1 Tax=Ceratina calcarata TaxID=156304 RepID=A0AAJ7J574_9HYME|nr:cilia- and flagella-associated protein 65 [Ceratina calcarata]
MDKIKIIRLEYEDVEVGKTGVKTIEIWNESMKNQVYQVQRDPATNPLDHVFHLRSYTWTLAPEEKYLCDIRYRPLVADTKNVDYFVITDTTGACMKIITRGSSIGPQVICSVTKIFMRCSMENQEVKRRIKLKNKSKGAATFMFNIDEKHKPFQLDTRYGVINPGARKYITITFTSPKEKRYTYYLVLLIMHQKPIIIELHGYLTSTMFDITPFTYPWQEKIGFKGYMTDVVDTLEDLPPVSLSKRYFNFGQADVDADNVFQRIPDAICLTNHCNVNVLIIWEEDSDGIFKIEPLEMIVQPHQSALFELTFNPNGTNRLYGREIIGSAFLEPRRDTTFPFVISVVVIGHSFPVTSNGWIPQYEIPQTVIMPPCVPPHPVYTTFLIKRFGHLPLMFQFISPQSSHFTVKPMLGVIYHDYQIVVVELAPESKNEQIYIERWTVIFNGNIKNESYIDFKGYAEYANIMMNNNNTLTFSPVLAHCQQFAQLGMRNVTRHKIRYQFYQLPPELGVEELKGEIIANDTLLQECYFSPTEPNVNYDFEVQCIVVVIKNELTVGSKICINLVVRGRSEWGSLEAIPREIHLGEIEYNDTKSLSFSLINPSPVNIYYKLICTHRNLPLENIDEDVKLHPASETIFAGSRKKISVAVTPRTPVYYQFAVKYLIRVNFRLDDLVPEQTPVKLCNVYCMCILPTIKVANVCAFGHNQKYSMNVSKPFLWRVMRINRLNKTLENMLPGEKTVLDMDLFPMIVNNGTVLIKWMIMNPSRMPVPLTLKRIKQCSCEPVVKKIGLSLQRTEIDCVHKDLCTLYVKSNKLDPKQETVLAMDIRYALEGTTVISWDLDIGHDRHIIFNLHIMSLEQNKPQSNFLTFRSVQFGQTYFGDLAGMYKINWMCNITNSDLPCSVDISNIHKINEYYRCEVFSCFTQGNVIKSGGLMPILLKFQPRMFGAYEVKVLITMGDKTEELTISGEASFDSRSASIGRPIPSDCACKTPLFPAYFSIDCIDMWCIPTHATIVKMLLIYNNLDYDALAYDWKCQEVLDIVRVDIFPRKGIMTPKAVQTFQVKIYTKGCPCRIDVNIPCIFFNASKRREYQRSIIKYNILSEELEGQFVITEKGTFVPKPWLEILDEPKKYYKTLSIRCSIYSAEDESRRINLLKELKAAPLDVILLDERKERDTVKKNELFLVTFILEGMLWDIVNSTRFRKIVTETLMQERNLYYSQFMMDLAERKRLVRRSYISPPLMLIHSILQEMLFIMVHEEFTLKTAHLIPDDDVRHRNYLKMLPMQKRIYLEEDYRREHNKPDANPEDEANNHLRSGFRVSFMED